MAFNLCQTVIELIEEPGTEFIALQTGHEYVELWKGGSLHSHTGNTIMSALNSDAMLSS